MDPLLFQEIGEIFLGHGIFLFHQLTMPPHKGLQCLEPPSVELLPPPEVIYQHHGLNGAAWPTPSNLRSGTLQCTLHFSHCGVLTRDESLIH